jgi:hypothetical protein
MSNVQYYSYLVEFKIMISCANILVHYTFAVYGTKHTNYMAVYFSHPNSLHRMDSNT